jgi:ABC-type antimicrobial peptide transport system permease subunit
MASAVADAALIAAQLDRDYPGRRTTIQLTRASRLERPLQQQAVTIAAVIAVLLTLLFLICGSNAASLLLARGAARQREIAVRVAIGAARAHIVRQLLAEVSVIALASGACGVLICFGAARLLVATLPVEDLFENLQPNAGVFFFAFAAAFASR